MQPSNFSAKDADNSRDGVKAMNDLIHSAEGVPEDQQTMLQLVSEILAGYCAQACSEYYKTDYIPPKARRAPIISVSYSDYAYPVLEQIVSSLAVDTTVVNADYIYARSGKPLEAKYRSLLPQRNKDRSITDSAYLKLPGLPHAVILQYRDTTMLVHCRFFPGTEIAELQRLNPWVSLVLYDTPSKKLLTSPVRINGFVLAASSGSWDSEKLRFVVERYAGYLSRKSGKKRWEKRIKTHFYDIEQMIARYNMSANNEPVKRAQKYQVSCQMLALRLFLDACADDNDITRDEATGLTAEWYNILLPGCCPKDDSESLFTIEEESEPFRVQFENAICGILQEDNYQHIYFISEGNICPLVADDDSETEYWAYVSWYESKKTAPHLVVRLRRKTFERLFPNYCQEYYGDNLFNDVSQLGEEYIDTLKSRMYRDETDAESKKTVDALVLNVDRMTFLPQEVINYLKNPQGQS